jgi:riboflavin transporter FmnP
MSDSEERFGVNETKESFGVNETKESPNANDAFGFTAQRPEVAKKPRSGGSQPRWGTRQLATMAMMLAIGIILSYIEFPLLPGADFLKFDAAFVPAIITGFSFGPISGCVVGVLVAAIHALLDGNIWGGVMNAVISIAFILPATIAYSLNRNTVSVIVGLIVSAIASIVVALLMNMLITPIYTGMPLEAVMGLMIFPLLPFNILKALINSVLAFVLHASLRDFLVGARKAKV